jgi:superfamily II DNA helicase RecQ
MLQYKDWQIEAAAEMLGGNDVMVVTATGTGKTLCFYLAAIARQNLTFLVVSPLVNLMDDQVRRADELGIKACALHMTGTIANPGLIQRIREGQYEMVYVSPEWCVISNPGFQILSASSTFRKRLGGIVIDEAHLCHAWRTFRPRYESLGLLRSFFPTTPVMAVSATMTPYVRRFVHTSVGLLPKTRFIHRPIDRPNIYLAAVPITKGVQS